MNRSDLLARQLAQLDICVEQKSLDRLIAFLDELLRWNHRINLTAITDPGAAIEKHLVDSLTIVSMLRGDERMLDLGSGGGFPSIPLNVVLPGLRVFSVAAVQKKIVFQRHAARLLRLDLFKAFHGRAEDLPKADDCAAGFDLIVSRAFASLPLFAALARPCLAPGGRIIAMKGAEGEKELAEARADLEALGLVCREVRRLRLPASGAERTLLVFGER